MTQLFQHKKYLFLKYGHRFELLTTTYRVKCQKRMKIN